MATRSDYKLHKIQNFDHIHIWDFLGVYTCIHTSMVKIHFVLLCALVHSYKACSFLRRAKFIDHLYVQINR